MGNFVSVTLTRLANWLFPYRKIVYVAIVFTLGLTVVNLQYSSLALGEQRLTGYLIAVIWLLLLNTLLHVFYQPQPPAKAMNWLARVKRRWLAFWQKLLVLVFVLVTVVALYLTVKLVTL